MSKLKAFNLLGISETESKEIVISPIFYMGNKRRLIQKGLINYFPKEINTFVDVFSGSAIVSMNVIAQNYIINDINEPLNLLYNMFTNDSCKFIIDKIYDFIDKYNLPRERTKRNVYMDKDKIECYKSAHKQLRDYYNNTKDVYALYTLMFYSFSQLMRFNSNGDFNMPYGNDCFCEDNIKYINNGTNFFSQSTVKTYKLDYRQLIDTLLESETKDYFFYFDPPYLNTLANYNENNGWTYEDEYCLYDILNHLTDIGMKWALSNVEKNKGIDNTDLINYVTDNNYQKHYFDNFTYTACGKGNANTVEILITNY